MHKFRKKPVIIEATKYTGTPESEREIIDWTRGSTTPASMDRDSDGKPYLGVATLESGKGVHVVSIGDWVIRGIQGEHYACKPDIFAATYELIEDSDIYARLSPEEAVKFCENAVELCDRAIKSVASTGTSELKRSLTDEWATAKDVTKDAIRFTRITKKQWGMIKGITERAEKVLKSESVKV
jgi:hypothetical protein